ncbi:hypothetical protein [Metapseudomonas furukawaii]|jgi:hypothetical protein|uniref:Uncharacterized protein n=1 Tax=Metapseudomonas furukawaii TaxID=1149133 RepID=A0AAD1FFN9_METFU|nr:MULTISPECIES: hypothetical protein [Pseudomonas]ELS26674.1 hypothetical protein ppKF707_3092 [Pseudomonas furukawaii]OWJ92712.1 hypothetical protein B6S59_19290 [Pseudomonas sp. A46]BAU74367.1 hypothetical protein KF707C_26790 [Pseudomonas furukawaii]
MPDQTLTFTPEQLELLEQVRRQQGLESIQQVAEWLAKQALRKHADRVPGRSRALVLVKRE